MGREWWLLWKTYFRQTTNWRMCRIFHTIIFGLHLVSLRVEDKFAKWNLLWLEHQRYSLVHFVYFSTESQHSRYSTMWVSSFLWKCKASARLINWRTSSFQIKTPFYSWWSLPFINQSTQVTTLCISQHWLVLPVKRHNDQHARVWK